MKHTLALVLASLLSVALFGCADRSLNSATLNQAFVNESGEVNRGPGVELAGAAATQNAATYGDAEGHWSVKTGRDPVIMDLSKPGAVAQMTGAMRGIRFDGAKEIGSITAFGTDDFKIDELTVTRDGTTVTLRGLGALASPVEAEVAKQLAIAAPTWVQLTKEEKEWAIARVTELVKLGQTMTQAVATVAGDIAARVIRPAP